MDALKQLFLVSTGQDTGGFNWRLYEAFRRNSEEWAARSMCATRTYIAYPEDLPYRRELLLELYAAADVVHLQNQAAGWELYDGGAGKPTVLQHHGTIFRDGHQAISAQAREVGMVEICSTLDLTLLEPDVTWLPVPYNLAELQALREQHYQPSEVVRIAHAPTNRRIKGTAHFLAVIGRLQARGLPVEAVLIEQQPWRRCLAQKATADIYYDQLELGYGCNAVEAWGMGMPVVAGSADPVVLALMEERWGRLPFYSTQPPGLEEVLERLVRSAAARAEYAQLGAEHFARWHDERVVTPMFEELYAAAPPTDPGPTRYTEQLRAKARRRADQAERRRLRQEQLAERRRRLAARA